MALDREQVGLLFKVSADSTDARQDLALFRGVVEGIAAELREQLGAALERAQRQFSQLSTTANRFNDELRESSTQALRGYVGQFGLLGDAAASLIPSMSGATGTLIAFTGVTVGAGAAMAGLASRTMDFTGRVDDLSQITGLTNETIQSLELAATLAGQSFESAAQTAVFFQRRMQEAKEGNEELRATLMRLGVDLNGDVDTAFRKAIESIGMMEAGAKRTSLQIALFGKSGAELSGILNQVNGDFEKLVVQAKNLGLVLNEQDIKAANDFADNLDILTLKAKGLANTIGVELIKALGLLGDAFAEAFPAEAMPAEGKTAPSGPMTLAEIGGFFTQQYRAGGAPKPKKTGTTAATGPTKEELNERNIRELEALEKAEQAEQDSLLRREAAYERYNQSIIDGFAKRNQANIDAMEAEDKAAFQEEELRLRSERQIDAYNQRILTGLRQRLEAELDAYADMLNRQEEERLRREALNPASALSLFGVAGDEAALRGAGLFGQLAATVNDSLGQMSDNLGNFQSIAADAFNNVAQGLEQVILTFIKTGQISGKVFKEMAAQIIASVAAQAAVKAIFELAEGFASLALAWVMPSMAGKAAGHFKAAAIYGSVAGIAIAAGAAMAGSVGPGENRFLESGGARGTRVMEQGREPVVVVVRAETEPGVIVRHVVTDYKANGETRQMLRRDLLAEAF